MNQLTPRQTELLEFIEGFMAQHGMAPTIREQMTGLEARSPSCIQNLLEHLRNKGYVDWLPRKPRSIRILHSLRKGVPVLGVIGASDLLETFTDSDVEYIPNDFFKLMGKPEQEISSYFALRVRGESMIGAAIVPGDVVILKPAREAIKDGSIVAARVGNAMTLKHYHRMSDSRIQLRPSNPSYKPIDVSSEDLDVQGIYVSLLRGLI